MGLKSWLRGPGLPSPLGELRLARFRLAMTASIWLGDTDQCDLLAGLRKRVSPCWSPSTARCGSHTAGADGVRLSPANALGDLLVLRMLYDSYIVANRGHGSRPMIAQSKESSGVRSPRDRWKSPNLDDPHNLGNEMLKRQFK